MPTLTLLTVGLALAAPVPKESRKSGPFDGRSGTERTLRLKEFGGSAKTEAAVEAGLKWLAAAQKPDGTWVFDGGQSKEVAAATGLSVLAFLGSGHTTKAGPTNPYANAVQRGLTALVKMQKPDGSFRTASTLYAHAIAATALCEAVGMTGDKGFQRAAQLALNYILNAQGADGSWGYTAKTNGDTSICGWQAQAIRAGQAARFAVDKKVLAKASRFLDTTMDAEKGSFGYRDKLGGRPSLTAVGMTARTVFDGWTGETAGIERGGAFVAARAAVPPYDTYLLYYASAAMPLTGEKLRLPWNKAATEVVLKNQVAKGNRDAGSWKPDTGFVGSACGVVGTTAMAVLTLENYYRYPFPLKARAK